MSSDGQGTGSNPEGKWWLHDSVAAAEAPPVDLDTFEQETGIRLPPVSWVLSRRLQGDVVAVSALDTKRRRHLLALVGRFGDSNWSPNGKRTTHVGGLMDRIKQDPWFAHSGMRTDSTLRLKGHHLEVGDGVELEMFSAHDAAEGIKGILRGIRGTRPIWQVLRIFPEAFRAEEPKAVALQRKAMVEVFDLLAAIDDLGQFALDKSGNIVDNELRKLVSPWLGDNKWEFLRTGTSVAVGARRLTPEHPEWKERSRGGSNAVEGGPLPTSDEVITALTDRVGAIADPLARLVLLDELSRELMPAVYEQMMAAAAEYRRPVEEGGQGGSWKAIGVALDVTASAAQNRLDPAARQRERQRSRERRQAGGGT